MLEKIFEFIFPNSCGICGKIYKDWICPKCYYKLKPELRYMSYKEDQFKLYYVGEYEGTIRNLLLKFKFNESAYLANMFVEVICKNQNFAQNFKKYDCVIPVPMYEKNKRIRGYNQSALLAKGIGSRLGIKYADNVLVKIKENNRQSELDGIHRAENVKNVYGIQNSELIDNKRVILVDDIYTTGSTVKECIRVLRKNNVKIVDVVVIAKTI